MLRIALEQQAQSVSLKEPDAPGGGKGILIQDDQTGTLSTVQNQSVCYPISTMLATRGDALGKNGFGVGDDGEAQFTLSAAHEHAVCIPEVSRTLSHRYDSSPCIDRGQEFVCYESECLNGWDVQSKHIQPENGIAECLWAGDKRYGGGESYVMQKGDET